MKKLVRITTVPISLEKLLEGQLTYMSNHFEVTAISSDKERLQRFGKDNGVATKYIPLTRQITLFTDLRALWLLYRYLRKHKPEIVHSHTPKAGLIGMMAAWLARVPHRLHTIAGLPVMEAKGLKRVVLALVERLTYLMATKVYPNSFELKKYILGKGWTCNHKLKVLLNGSSNGIDTQFFSPLAITQDTKSKWLKSLEINSSDLVFIFVGRLVGDKGINELTKAFKELSSQFDHLKLLLIGPLEEDLDPLETGTMDIIKNNRQIHMLGYQQDVRPFFAIADVLVFPSYREGFPNVVLQAASMGLASIVSDINGCNEIISHGNNGLIVPAKEAFLLEQAMKSLIINTPFREQIRSRARTSVVSRFERSEFWKALLQEYRFILNQ